VDTCYIVVIVGRDKLTGKWMSLIQDILPLDEIC